ncbi:hypothetical protein MUU72_05290 [Streptomyces sp. RS10V-4]|uniref:hypothetical protein n=1 Tax=Streptomyces rhizoryzae TaxID=2932493 RepID=UPI002004CFFB|nr:hypothetical protein [Streptomyces rhizoryzae]MCK7622525.1 hypothetical protein [Streptomyces rhizoryzae]
MGRRTGARRHRPQRAADRTPPFPADGPPRADDVPGGRLPPHQEPKPKRPVRTIRVRSLFG